MALPSHWKFQIEIDFLEDLATQLKIYVTFKDRNVVTLYLEAPKRPNSRLLRMSPPRLRRPSKIYRGQEEDEEETTFFA